jgi:arylsulfatase A-like enzyme
MLAACCAATACTGRAPTHPNVLLIVIDALRADALGVNGYRLPTSPAIDALAAEGVNFTAAFAPATWTRSSMATLMTSLYPPQHGIQAMIDRREGQFATVALEERFVTLAEAMQAGGYRTGAVVDQVHLQERFGFGQGFEAYEAGRGWQAPGLRRRLLEWLDAVQVRPFFAYVHFLDVHWPYCSRLEPADFERFGGSRWPPGPEVEECDRAPESAMPAREQRARYDAEVAFVDHEIGALVAELARRSLYEETIVVVTADHGEAFGERGTMRHAGAPHLEQARVPLVIRLPRRARPPVRTVEELVSLADVAPTLLELARVSPLPAAEGRSLVPLWRGGALPERFVYSQGGGALAVRGARWTWLQLGDGAVEIYDRSRDPGERVPVHWPCTGDCGRLAGAGERYQRLARRVRSTGRVTEPLTAEDLAELRALGYL